MKKRLHPIPRVIVIVACQHGGKSEYLVLRKAGKKGAFQPVAGHLDQGDLKRKNPHRSAALRELKEETGLAGKLAYLGIVDRKPKKGQKYTIYAAKVYLLRLKRRPAIDRSKEHRTHKWRRQASTMEVISHSPRYPKAMGLAAKKLTR